MNYFLLATSIFMMAVGLVMWYAFRPRYTYSGTKSVQIYPLRECPECGEMKSFPDGAEGKDANGKEIPARCYDCFVHACDEMENKA